MQEQGDAPSPEPQAAAPLPEPAYMEELSTYTEMLYEDLAARLKGTAAVLTLAKSPGNLEQLIQDEPLLAALSRLLREEGRNSMDLVTNVVEIFFCFSNYSAFHSFLSQNSVGSFAMKTISLETKRYALWMEELEKHKLASDKDPSNDGLKNALNKKAKKLRGLLGRQERLLLVCFHVLLNLAEDPNSERKMRKKGLIPMLTGMLDRTSPRLLTVVLLFLKKLSIFRENKNEMTGLGLIPRLVPKLSARSGDLNLLNLTIRLLFNLSFDASARETMMRGGVVPKAVALVSGPDANPAIAVVALRLLYQLSLDDHIRTAFAQGGGAPAVMKLLLDSGSSAVGTELAALAVNIASSPTAAEALFSKPADSASLLLRKALQNNDPLLLKAMRAALPHVPAVANAVAGVATSLGRMAVNTSSVSLRVEAAGLLGAVGLYSDAKVDWNKQARELDLSKWFTSQLRHEVVEDDVLLEVLLWLEAVLSGSHDVRAEWAGASTLPVRVHEVLCARQDDPEIVLGSSAVLYHWMCEEASRTALIDRTNVVDVLIELACYPNDAVAAMGTASLDIAVEESRDLAASIRQARFRTYNAQWLELVELEYPLEDLEGGGYGDYEHDLYLDDAHHHWGNGAELDEPNGGGALLQIGDNWAYDSAVWATGQ